MLSRVEEINAEKSLKRILGREGEITTFENLCRRASDRLLKLSKCIGHINEKDDPMIVGMKMIDMKAKNGAEREKELKKFRRGLKYVEDGKQVFEDYEEEGGNENKKQYVFAYDHKVWEKENAMNRGVNFASFALVVDYINLCPEDEIDLMLQYIPCSKGVEVMIDVVISSLDESVMGGNIVQVWGKDFPRSIYRGQVRPYIPI
jgi:hypothetical protein